MAHSHAPSRRRVKVIEIPYILISINLYNTKEKFMLICTEMAALSAKRGSQHAVLDDFRSCVRDGL